MHCSRDEEKNSDWVSCVREDGKDENTHQTRKTVEEDSDLWYTDLPNVIGRGET